MHARFTAAKRRINYAQTFRRLFQLAKDPAPIRPDSPPEHLLALLPPRKLKTPKLKGNVVHTMKEVLHLFLAGWREAKAEINLAVRTTRAALAKRCQNLDPKTAYRHILALIEHGFLRAKVHVKGGLQLLLNPALIVFDGAAPGTYQVAPAAAAPVPVLDPAAARAQVLHLAEKFTHWRGRRT